MDWAERKTWYSEAFFKNTIGAVDSDGQAIRRSYGAVPGLIFARCGQPRTILECGCAVGSFLLDFAELPECPAVWGFDLGEYAIQRALPEIRENVALLDAATEELPFPSRYFDLTLAFDFFEHQDEEYFDFVMSNVCRVTKNYIMIRQPFTVFNMPFEERHPYIASLNHLTHDERRSMIDNCPEITTSIPDPNCPFHPQERGFAFWLETFASFGFLEERLPEEMYLFPNGASICSFNSLLLKRGA